MKANLKLFLDIDGVMIPTISKEPNTFSKESVSVINELCNDYNVIIICISTRITKMSVEEIKKLFNDNGIFCEIEVAPLTEPFDKYASLKEYFRHNLLNCQFLIFDDEHFVPRGSMFCENFTKTLGFKGLTQDHVHLSKDVIAEEILVWDDGPQETLDVLVDLTVRYRFTIDDKWTYLNYHISRPDLLQDHFDGKITAYELGYNSHVYLSKNDSYTYISPEEFSLKYLYLKRASWFLDFKPEILPHAIALLNTGIIPNLHNT